MRDCFREEGYIHPTRSETFSDYDPLSLALAKAAKKNLSKDKVKKTLLPRRQYQAQRKNNANI